MMIPLVMAAADCLLRGLGRDVVAERIKEDIQKRVTDAGIEVIEARITYLAYVPEIVAVMLQRQQATVVDESDDSRWSCGYGETCS